MISLVQSPDMLLNSVSTNSATKQVTGDAAFKDTLEAVQNIIDANLEAEAETTELTTGFLTGANDNIHSLLISQQKSSILLQYTLQLRNGVLNAYKEIMQLSI